MMNNYAEAKKELTNIRNKYSCAGDLLFRTAIQCVMEHGTDSLLDDWTCEHLRVDINERHDDAEAEGNNLILSREWEFAILDCARELAQVDTYYLLIYIQQEVWLGGDGINYQRAIQLLKQCLSWIEDDRGGCDKMLDVFDEVGFFDNEIEEIGWGFLFNAEEDN